MKPWKLTMIGVLSLAAIVRPVILDILVFNRPLPARPLLLVHVLLQNGSVRQLVSAPGQLVETQQTNLTVGSRDRLMKSPAAMR